MPGFYDSDAAIAQYLLFHFGTPEQICPLLPEARGACGFATRCVSESLEKIHPAGTNRALDLGCAVGRSTFELGRSFEEVLGIDFSSRFIEAAREIQSRRTVQVAVPREGSAVETLRLDLPADLPTDRAHFEQGDAGALRTGLGRFDLVLMANLIDRLPDPARCLSQMARLVRAKGWLVITSPYTWLEEYTPREKWLQAEGQGTLDLLRTHLEPDFTWHQSYDLPFLIREHLRKYQWSIAEVSLWRRH